MQAPRSRRRQPHRRGGRPDRKDAEKIRQAILRAAEAAFLNEGFAGARIEAIAAKAGTSKQTVYSRFGSKEELFVEVSNNLLKERFARPPSAQVPLEEALLDVAEQMLAAILDPKLVRMFCIITAEAARFPELARLSDEDTSFPGRTLMQAILEQAMTRGEITCEDPHRAMTMLQQMVLAAPLRAASLKLDSFSPSACRDWAAYAVKVFLNGTRLR